VTLRGPDVEPPVDADGAHALGSDFWPLVLLRELDDALLELRCNEPDIGTIVFASTGDIDRVLRYDRLLATPDDRFLHEVRLFARRVLKRIDVTSRSLCTLVTPESCFAGFLAEIVLAADRTYMLDGGEPAAHLILSDANFSGLEMPNGLSRLATR